MRSRIALVMFDILAGLAYLGLAVLGKGGKDAFFSSLPLTLTALVFLALTIAAIFTKGNVSPGVEEDRSNRWVIGAISVIGIAMAYVPPHTDRTGFFCLDGEPIRWVGLILFAGGGYLRIWPVFVLGNRFSGLVAIQPGHTLVTSGVYGMIRHPSYLGLLVNSLGWALVFRSGTGVVLTLLIVPVLLARIRAEERLLASRFGAEYEAYRARTWRLIPWVY